MAFNFSELIAAETKKVEEAAASSNGGGIGFKTVYPFSNGRLEFKFIGNEPSGLLYRELVFHEYWSNNKKQKVPCLHQMYGLDCPICNAVSNVQNTLDDKDVFGKYGFKRQGIMFAKLLNFAPENYFGDNRNPPKAGDIVLFMFPKTVINELRNLIVEFQDEVENIFTNNETRAVTLKVGTQANGFPEYTFYVKGNTAPLCVDQTGAPDAAAFMQYMHDMPNLNEVKFPSNPDENMLTIHRTVVEEINRKYFGDAVGDNIPNPVPMVTSTFIPPAQTATDDELPNWSVPNTSTSVNQTAAPIENAASVTPVNSAPSTPTPVTPPAAPADSRGQRPPCFGNNEYNDKCSACPWDNECV